MTRLFLLSLLLPAFLCARARTSGYCEQGGATVHTGAAFSQTKVQQSFPGCTVKVYVTGGAAGSVSTSGVAVTWISGVQFNSSWAGGTIVISGVQYTIQSAASSTSLTLTTSAGTQTAVAYSMSLAPAQIYSNDSGTNLSNPFTADQTGYWYFYADDGVYDVAFSGAGISTPFTLGSISSISPSFTANVMNFGAKNDGTTDNAAAFALAAAWANAGSNRSLYFPDGAYNYSSGLSFTQPVTLYGSTGAVLNYSGSAHAVDMGPAGLTVSTFQANPYRVIGLTFTGGASMTKGVYFAGFIVNTVVNGTHFSNFGNSAAWNIFYQYSNWYNLVDGVLMWSDSSHSASWNGIRNNGTSVGGTSDSGQSRTIVTNTLIQALALSTGTGIYLNSFHGIISQSTVAGFQPAVQLGGWANNAVIDHLYTETYSATAPAILWGDAGSGSWVVSVTVRDSYFNCHNSSVSPTSTAHPIGPATGTIGVSQWRLLNNTVADLATGEPIIVENNVASQTGNYAESNYIVTSFPTVVSAAGRIHTMGGSRTLWNGTDEQLTLSNQSDTQNLIIIKAGSSTQQVAGIYFEDYQGNITGGVQGAGSGIGNRTSLIGPGNVVGAQILNTAKFSITSGIDVGGGGMKVALNAALGCTTAASIGATCTGTYAFSPAFADTNYALTCTLNSVTGQPHIVGTVKSVGSWTLKIAADTAVAAGGNMDCVAVHN